MQTTTTDHIRLPIEAPERVASSIPDPQPDLYLHMCVIISLNIWASSVEAQLHECSEKNDKKNDQKDDPDTKKDQNDDQKDDQKNDKKDDNKDYQKDDKKEKGDKMDDQNCQS